MRASHPARSPDPQPATDQGLTWDPFREVDLATFQAHILGWYDTFKRDLPWRGDPDPYHILVSEVMLQQTQVDL